MKKASSSSIKIAVVGYGGAYNMGRQHLLEAQKAGFSPVAVAEIDPARLAVAEEDFPGIGLYHSVDDLLGNSDAELVVIITPHNTHAPLALRCLKAKRHVVCEKPLAITTAEVDSLIAAATKSSRVLSTYHNRHWDGRIRLAVDLIHRKKAIGDIIRIDCHMGAYRKPGDAWRTSRSISGGILYDWGVHLLEYSLQLIQDEVTEVSGYAFSGFWGPQTRWGDDANEDEAFATVRFARGSWLTLRMTTIDSKPAEGWLVVTGTKGTLVMDATHTTLHDHKGPNRVTTRMPNPDDESFRFYENVHAHLLKNEPLVITPEWSRRPIHVLDLAVRSAAKGRALPAKYG